LIVQPCPALGKSRSIRGVFASTRLRTIWRSSRKEPVLKPKQWQDLTDRQKRGIVILGALQLALLAASLIDIQRRPAEDINGSKRLWTMVVFINGIGPIAYFLFGRKRQAPAGAAI
jgi:hypothetical protein